MGILTLLALAICNHPPENLQVRRASFATSLIFSAQAVFGISRAVPASGNGLVAFTVHRGIKSSSLSDIDDNDICDFPFSVRLSRPIRRRDEMIEGVGVSDRDRGGQRLPGESRVCFYDLVFDGPDLLVCKLLVFILHIC